ncbi:MAG: hypothetical protein ACRDJW_21670 [Thermomicrobiales bacterium]
MEQRNLGEWLARQFSAERWERGISKDDLIAAAGDDESLARHLEQYPEGGLYRGPDEVLQGSAHHGWEDQQMPGPRGDAADTSDGAR